MARYQDLGFPDLLPCPFCGGRPYLEQHSRAFIAGESERVTYVRCTQCSARSGRRRLADYGRTSNSREAMLAVVADWNMRYDLTTGTVAYDDSPQYEEAKASRAEMDQMMRDANFE